MRATLIFGMPSSWEGGLGGSDLVVRPHGYCGPVTCGRTIHTALGPDPHFHRHVNGYMVRQAAVREIFHQFGGRWTLIVINWPGLNRMIFFDKRVCSFLYREGPLERMVMADDGHNEDAVLYAVERGFNPMGTVNAEGEWLEMVR